MLYPACVVVLLLVLPPSRIGVVGRDRRDMASIGELGSIDAKQATRLRKAGIRTTEALLRHTGTRQSRLELAGRSGLPAAEILVWARRADIMRVRGIGAEYATLLEAVGIITLTDLCRWEPVDLMAALVEANTAKRFVRRLPSESMVDDWLVSAAQLDPLVKT